jgi:heme A synthase
MQHRRWVGASLAAVALAVVLGGPVQADDTTNVSVTGPSSGVTAHCPEGMQATTSSVTDGDGKPLGPGQRVRSTLLDGGNGVGAWIAAYDNSPPPPATITLTVTCSC